MSRTVRAISIVIIAVIPQILCVPGPLSAAEDLSLVIDRLESGEFPQVVVDLVVVNDKGLPIQGIPAGAIVATEDGKGIPNPSLFPLVAAQQPMAVTMVVDTSLSMAGKPLEDAREAASSFVDDIGAKDVAAIIAFAGEVFPIRDFTSDKGALKNELSSLVVSPNTALYDAVVRSTEVARQSTADRRVIVLLTDGEDTSSRHSFEAAAKVAEAARIPIYTIGLGPEVDRRVLDQFALSTGGRSLYAPSAADLQSAYRALASQLRSRYVLRLRSQLRADDQQHSLSISVNYQGKKAEGRATFTAKARPPRIVYLSPRDTTLTGKSTVVEVKVESAAPVAKVQFSVDHKLISEVIREPFRFVWYRDAVEPGPHTLAITAIDSVSNSSTKEIMVQVNEPSKPLASFTDQGITPTPVPNMTLAEGFSFNWPPLAPFSAAGLLLFGLGLAATRRSVANSGRSRRSSRLRLRIRKPRCPICGNRYSPHKGCAQCREQEEKAISERLRQIFLGDYHPRKRAS